MLGDLEIRAASVVGADHRCTPAATARQDAYRLGRDAAGRYLLVAVADGVSEATRSDIGATVAARASVDLLRRQLDDGVSPAEIDFRELFKTVAQHIVGAASQVQAEPQELLTALIVAIVPTAPEDLRGGRTVRLASVADVSAWRHEETTWRQLAGEVKSGLDRNSLRTFLPHYWDAVVVREVVLPAGSALAFMTDGVGDALADIAGGAEWFAVRWRQPPALASFLLDTDYEAVGQVDDRTAVVVWSPSNGGEVR
ncbi:protein phosphatase 2C domain-containing protein [Amycolatopsis sp. NBC_00355]|uniref:protein phosphatase 2C domain-containing protein n=1 Tax=Amycolatopsis sp. NBC_00355 TaxID=2975957 RepID=UPI002E2769CE